MKRTLPIYCALLAGLLAPLRAPAQSTAGGEWWRSAVCYEVFVRSFLDSDGDGVGDLRGLTSKLDYINDGNAATAGDLGADCIWLMPIAQSPSYHGYDVTNYYAINRDYGTRADFTRFMDEAHSRGIRVIVDLVLNHTSNEHPWFKSAVLEARSPFRDWYVWSPSVRPSPGWQAPVWHHINTRDEYYYGLFWSGMPDLNLANPSVRAETERIARFWVDSMKVDGFRLDAVAHFFEESDGQWKDAAAVYPWLRDYAAAVHRMRPGLFTVGEVYDDLDSVKRYYPDKLDSFFLFEVADAVIESVRSGVKQPLIDIVGRVAAEIPAGRGATFLRNHDQTRTMTELAGDVARAKLAATLLFTLPGIPFVYYGEEIGMTGAKPAGDPRLRTPMQWRRAPAAGFTKAMPWEPLQPDSFSANVAAQTDDPSSLLSTYRSLIRLRGERPGLAAGAFVPLTSTENGPLSFVRPLDGRALVVIANLGETPLSAPKLSSATGALPPGRYRARVLAGEGSVAELRVGRDGRLNGWTPLRTIAPLRSVVIELVRA